MFFVRLTFLLLFATNISIAADEISMTFDDLPGAGVGSSTFLSINTKILDGLERGNVSSVAFVNEGKLYGGSQTKFNDGMKALRAWVNRGHPLANHTYSHYAFSKTDLEVFKSDTLKGSILSKSIMQHTWMPSKYKYFRYPYTDIGKTEAINAAYEFWLKRRGYKIAPITISNADWVFNREIVNNPQNKDLIIRQYLEFTKGVFDFYEEGSRRLFGRNIKHIWLLHANVINTLAIDSLISFAKKRGYVFTTLDRVLKDPAYLERDNHKKSSDSFLDSLDNVRHVFDWTTYPNMPYVW